jgi:hypothetical protein
MSKKEQEQQEPFWDKAVRKSTKEPLIPIGAFVTTLILGFESFSLYYI